MNKLQVVTANGQPHRISKVRSSLAFEDESVIIVGASRASGDCLR